MVRVAATGALPWISPSRSTELGFITALGFFVLYLMMAVGAGGGEKGPDWVLGVQRSERPRRGREVSLQNVLFSVLAVLGLLGIAAAVCVHEPSGLAAVANVLRAGGLVAQ